MKKKNEKMFPIALILMGLMFSGTGFGFINLGLGRISGGGLAVAGGSTLDEVNINRVIN